MSDSPSDVLRKARILKGYESAADAARAHGWSQATYTSHENGTRGIRPDAAKRYAQAFGVDEASLMGIRGRKRGTTFTEGVPVIARARVGVWMDTRFDAGHGSNLGSIYIPNGGGSGDMSVAILIEDKSVSSKINSGEYAVCQPVDGHSGVEDGALVFVEHTQGDLVERSIRLLTRLGSTVRLQCASSDAQFAADEISIGPDGNDDVTVIAKVVGKYSAI